MAPGRQAVSTQQKYATQIETEIAHTIKYLAIWKSRHMTRDQFRGIVIGATQTALDDVPTKRARS